MYLGADGLFDIQKDLLCKNQQIWSGYQHQNKFIIDCMEKGMRLTDKELDDTIKRYLDDTKKNIQSTIICVSSYYIFFICFLR